MPPASIEVTTNLMRQIHAALSTSHKILNAQ